MARRPQLIVDFGAADLAPLIRQISEFEQGLADLLRRHQDPERN